ncbi:MAG: amidohydrolase family protein, partial [Woeseiaceae bacterium]
LKSMTTTAAWQMHMENKIGSIEVGKYADFAIMDNSLRDTAPGDLVDNVKVVGTLLNGEFTHRDGM